MGDIGSLAPDMHHRVLEFLTWHDNTTLSSCSRYLHDVLAEAKFPIWWGQAQATDRDADEIIGTFVSSSKVRVGICEVDDARLRVELVECLRYFRSVSQLLVV